MKKQRVHYINNSGKITAVIENTKGVTIAINDNSLTAVSLPVEDKKGLGDQLTKEERKRYAKDKQK